MWLCYSYARVWRDVFHRGVVCTLGLLEALDVLRYGFWMLDLMMSKGVPLLPLYTRGAGLHDGVLVGYGTGVLVGYNCTSSV